MKGTDLRFFDANCMIGRQAKPQPGTFFEVEKLLEEMDYYGIEETLLFHSSSRWYHPVAGNKKLLEEIKGEKRLRACWVLLPSHTKEMPKPDLLIREMLSKGVKAVRLFPNQHLFSLSPWSVGDLFKALEEHRIPTFLDFGSGFSEIVLPFSDATEWETIYNLCQSYPSLPIILVQISFRTNRKFYPLLKECSNLYLELSGCSWSYREIEAVSREIGAGRLLFGTKLPFYNPGLALATLTYARVSEKEKKLIAGDNLRQLLKKVK